MKKVFFTPQSPFHFAWLDPRVAIVISLLFAFAIAFSQKLPILTSYCIGVVLLAFFTKKINKNCVKKIFLLNVFIATLFLLLPLFSSGKIIFTFLMLDFKYDGFIKSSEIALRANGILLIMHIFLSPIPTPCLAKAFHSLGVPIKLVQNFLFMVRYIETIGQEYQRLSNAAKLRGFQPAFNYLTFQTYGYLVGLLFLRSLSRAERILEAMKCRGFEGRFVSITAFRIQRRDYFSILTTILATFLLFYLEFFYL